jgi:hypothetical protein
MTNPAYHVGRNVRDRLARQIWEIIAVATDGLQCERRIGRKVEKRRFTFDQVEPCPATAVARITRPI